MKKRQVVTLGAIVAAMMVSVGGFAQDVPEEPDVPEAPAASEQVEAPDAAEAPEAPDAPAAPTAPPSLTFETTVGFEPVKRITLEGQAGDIALRGVEFTVSAAKGGMLGTSDADLKAVIGVMLDCATEADKKAKLDLTVQFLDADGAVIDRVDNSIGLKAGQKTFETKLTTLKYVVPLITSATITAVAK
jgi:hypothetical protein